MWTAALGIRLKAEWGHLGNFVAQPCSQREHLSRQIWVLILSNFCFLDNTCKRCFKFLFLHPRDSPCHHSPYLGVHASSREPCTWFLWDVSSSPSALPHQSFPKWSSHFPLSLISGWKKGPGNCHFNKVQPASHRTEKDQFSLQSQRKATPKNVQTTTQLHSSNTLAK